MKPAGSEPAEVTAAPAVAAPTAAAPAAAAAASNATDHESLPSPQAMTQGHAEVRKTSKYYVLGLSDKLCDKARLYNSINSC